MSKKTLEAYKRLSVIWMIIFFVSSYFIFGTQLVGLNDKTVNIVRAASETISCNAGGSRTLTVGTYTDSDGTQFSTGADLILNVGTTSSCTFTINGSISLASLTVQTGVTVTHSANTTAQTNTLSITTTGDMDIQSGGSIDISGKGYAGGIWPANGSGPGGGGTINGTGPGAGGHGGMGGSFVNTGRGGVTYCDVTNPITMGSGGGKGSGTPAGAGGGLFIANVSGTFTLNGTIAANGMNTSTNGGTGAGGGVNITAGTIAGTPTSFNISGGNNSNSSGSGGGGGCALLSYTISNTISPTSSYFLMGGGAVGGATGRGGAGVVYVKQAGTNGDLFAVNSGTLGASTTQANSSLNVNSITLNTSTIYIVTSTKTLILQNNSPFSGSNGTGSLVINSGGIFTPTTSGSFTVANVTLQLDSGGTLTNSSTLGMTIGNNGTFSLINFTTSSSALALNTLTIQSGGTLTHTANTTAQISVIKLALTTMTVDAGGTINLDGKGYAGGAGSASGSGTGAGTYNGSYGSGASHGGDGANSTAASGGTAYCDITNLGTIGSSGAGGNVGGTGGAGGGLLVANISGTFTMNGSFTAKGSAGAGNGAGGAGGGVNITAETIAGTPTGFNISGGAAGTGNAGGGGGGCALLTYTTSNTISPTSSYFSMGGGGTGKRGGAGIVYVKQANSSGDLFSINSGTSGATTTQSLVSLTANSLTLSTSTVYLVTSAKTLTLQNSSPFSGGNGTGILIVNSGGTFTPTTTNFTVANATLQLNDGSSFTNSSTLAVTVGSGGTFSLANYTTSSTALALSTLTIQSGGSLTHATNTTAQNSVVNLSVTTMTVNSGGSINLDGKGYSGGGSSTNGSGPGAGGGANGYGGGAGHSGTGGTTSGHGAAGVAYCNNSNPNTIGSGGGGGNVGGLGGAGGGLLILNVTGVFTLDGSFTAKGSVGTGNGAGGAGGGAKITANTIAGTPTGFNISGGNGGGSNPGGGGGGCAFLSYAASNTITSGSVTKNGGTGGTTATSTPGSFTASQSNTAPTVSALSPSQTSSNSVTVTTTVTDGDLNTTSLAVLYSTDGTTWVSSTIATVSEAGEGNGATTSTGSIIDIDTNNDGSINLTFTWDIATDLPNTSDSTVYLKITPNDGAVDGTAVSSTAFSVDTLAPSTPLITTSPQTINSASITIDGTAEADTTITITGGAATATGTATGGNFSISVPLTQDAINTLSVNATDAYNNTSAADTVVIVEDSAAPSAPVITDPAVTTSTIESSSYTVVGTAEADATVSISGGSATATGTATGGNFSIPVSLTIDATNYLSAITIDAAGNTSTPALFDIIQQSTSSYHFIITGTASQTAGTEQTITLTLKSGAGNTVTSYTGDKNVILSGPSLALNGTQPTCTDKNSTDVNLGSITTMTFASGVATCNLKLYKAENISLDADEGSYSSSGNSAYDLDINVSVGSFAVLSLDSPASALSGTAFVVTSTIKDSWWNIVTTTADNTLLTISAGSVLPSSIVAGDYIATGIVATDATITAAATEVSNLILTFTNGAVVATSTIAVTGSPADPSSVSASRSSDNQFVVTWQDNSTVESGYVIERNTDTGAGWGGWVEIGTVATSTAIYNDTTTVVEQRYQYRVKASGIGTAGDSGYNTDSQVHYTTPDAPSNVVGARTSDTQFAISYTDNAAVTDWHVVERCDNGGCDATYSALSGSPFSSSPVSELGTIANSRYRWQVAGQTPSSSPENLLSSYASSNYEYTTPAVPSAVSSTRLSDSQISVDWTDGSAYEDGFRVEISIDDGSWLEVTPGENTVGAGIVTAVVNTSTVGHSFNARVRAHIGATANNIELFSGYATAGSVIYGRPAAPATISAVRVSDSLVNVDWASSLLADSYQLMLKEDNGDWTVVMSPTNVLTYAVTAVSTNHSYFFRVNAFKDALESDFTTTTSALYTSPSVPSSVTPTYISDSQIDLAWGDASTYEDGFIVRLNDNGGSWQTVTTTASDVSGFSVISGLTGDHLYQFDVASFIGSITTTPLQSADIYTTPANPSNVTSTLVSSSITVDWSDNSAYEQGFVVEVDVDGGGFVSITSTAPEATSFVLATTTVDHYYQFRIKSYRGSLNSSYDTASINYGPLAVPSSVSATRISDAQINISWTDNSLFETGYTVEMSEDSGDWSVVSTTAADVADVSITSGISVNHSYEFRVKAFNTNTQSEFVSASGIVYTTPSPPSGLVASYISDTQIDLAWTDNSGSVEDGFRVEKKINDGSWEEITTGANTVNANISSYSFTSSSVDNKYEFRVRAARDSLLSSYATDVTPVYTTPSAPSTISASYVSDDQIDLTWTDNSDYEEAFKVQYQEDGGSWQLVSTTASNVVAYSFISGSQNHKYSFRVLAYKGVRESAYSTTASEIFTTLPAPTILVPSVDSATAITWSWTDNSQYEESFYLHVISGGVDDVTVVTSTSSYTTTVLPNTQYVARVSSFQTDRGESTLSASSTAVYSLANIPTAVSLTANQTAVSMTWGANNNTVGTEYYAENTTQGTNSGWITDRTWNSTGLTCGTSYSFTVKAKNVSGTETSSTLVVSLPTSACDVVQSNGGGGGVFSSGALTQPVATSDNVEGGFAIRINDDATEVATPNVTLKLYGGPDAVRMAISNTADFSNVSQEIYGTARTWSLTPNDGLKTVYVKFFNSQGIASPVVFANIMLNTAAPKISVEELPSSFDQEQIIVVKGITKPGAAIKAIIFGKTVTTTTGLDGVWKINLPKLYPGLYSLKLEAKDQLGKVSLPSVVPISIRQPLSFPIIFDFQSIKPFTSTTIESEFTTPLPVVEETIISTSSLALKPLPRDLVILMNKLPELKDAMSDLNIRNMGDVMRLSSASIYLPTLSHFGLITTTGLNFSKLEIKAMPAEFVFFSNAGGNIEIHPRLLVSKDGAVSQVISSVTGKQMSLIVKPETGHKIQSVKGRLLFKSRSVVKEISEKTTRSVVQKLFSIEPANAEEIGPNTELVMQEFEYTDQKNSGVYTASLMTPAVDGIYDIITEINYEEKKMQNKELHMIMVVDPEGYVFEKIGDQELRIKNAKVSLHWLNPDTGKFELWPGEKYLQKNPLLTDVTGRYSFLAPDGTYYLEAEARNYVTYKGEIFVLNQDNEIHLNIEMVKVMPEVKAINGYWYFIGIVLLFILILLVSINLIINKYKK